MKQIKRTFISFTLCLLSCLIIEGCVSSRYSSDFCYRLYLLDTNFISNLNLLEFINNNNDKIYVISEKNTHYDFDSASFSPLENLKTYCIELNEPDSPIKAIMPFEADRGGGGAIYIGDKLFWKNGYIVTKVYISNDIKGTFVSRNKIKND